MPQIIIGVDGTSEFYLNGDPDPVLVVEDMKHGMGQKGSVGIFVDIGTEAFVSELKVTCTDEKNRNKPYRLLLVALSWKRK